MKSLRWAAILSGVAILVSVMLSACHPTFVVLPDPATDTLAADTARDSDTRPRVPARRALFVDTVIRTDTVHRVDTVAVRANRPARVDTVRIVRVDTVRMPRARPRVRTDTVVRVDTVRVPERVRPPSAGPAAGGARVDTVIRVDTVTVVDQVTRVDTVTVVSTVERVDTVEVTVVDTVTRVDTVQVRVPGRRLLFLPPGHFPPEGECRVWVHGLAPGQQARSGPCEDLGRIPSGAFVLFGGDAWDFDYDWVAESLRAQGEVPPEIVALKRRQGGA